MRLEQVFRVQQSLETTQDGPCWYPMGCLVYDVHMPHIFTYFQFTHKISILGFSYKNSVTPRFPTVHCCAASAILLIMPHDDKVVLPHITELHHHQVLGDGNHTVHLHACHV